MPRIFDKIDQSLLPSLIETIQVAKRAGFCVGYFNLRGWKQLDCYIDQWSGVPPQRVGRCAGGRGLYRPYSPGGQSERITEMLKLWMAPVFSV